jgi:hypothetical protein
MMDDLLLQLEIGMARSNHDTTRKNCYYFSIMVPGSFGDFSGRQVGSNILKVTRCDPMIETPSCEKL